MLAGIRRFLVAVDNGPAPPLEPPDRPFVPGEPRFVTRGADGLVAASDADVYGGLAVGDVDVVLTPISRALASCADGVRGYATVHMEITAAGRVASSRVRRSSYGDARRDACLHAQLATATFPATAYSTHAEYTFTLTPR